MTSLKQPDFQPLPEALMEACFLMMWICSLAILLDFLF